MSVNSLALGRARFTSGRSRVSQLSGDRPPTGKNKALACQSSTMHSIGSSSSDVVSSNHNSTQNDHIETPTPFCRYE